MCKFHQTLNGKNINFLIGSGASFPIFKTLYLGTNKPTVEELLSSKIMSPLSKKAIYYFYYKEWIKPMLNYQYSDKDAPVLKNYYKFINFILRVLDTNGSEKPKRANIFTTNYDLLFEQTFEKALNNHICFFNDGSSGFINKTLNSNYFNISVSQTGYYDNYKKEIPTINLLKMHGSISWYKSKDSISLSYNNISTDIPNIAELDKYDFRGDFISKIENKYDLQKLNTTLLDITSKISFELEEFYSKYKRLAIINPDKWKFHDTLFEQHYYQIIRNFSYELEKPNTVLIVFAFSFADEHIEEIFKRSLSNPQLEVIIICYSKETQKNLQNKFSGFNNISYYPKNFLDNDNNEIYGDFSYFNKLLDGDYDE